MEIGFVTVPTSDFVLVSSVVKNFSKPCIIMGVPRDGDASLNSGYVAAARVKGVSKNAVLQTTFMVRLVQPNDSWCNYTWWTPVVKPAQLMSYMVMPTGHYNVSGAEFDIRNGVYNSHCTYLFYRHLWTQIFYNRAVRPASVATTQTMNDYRF
eukprot:gene48974-65661_t